MTSRIKLKSPRYRVVLGDVDDPDTWEEFEVQAIGADQVRAESIFARRKWGQINDFRVKFADLSAWCALTRTGQLDATWEQFQDLYIEVTGAEDDEEGDTVPTRPAPEAG